MRAWGHTIRLLTSNELAEQARQDLIGSTRRCRASRKCQNKSAFMLRYYYATIRMGRVSHVDKPICEVHAAKYLGERPDTMSG